MTQVRESFKVLCQDSLQWLQEQPDQSLNNVITGLPDLNELGTGITLESYLDFFRRAVTLIFTKIKPEGYAIFIQTDRRYEGQLLDKSYIITDQAYHHPTQKFRLLWHKIVCTRDIGKIDLFRPTYSHILCYSVKGSPGSAFEDVFPVGGKLYENSTPYNVAQAMAKFIPHHPSQSGFDVIDPFVGQGTIGCAVIQTGLSFLGIDLDPQQCQLTRELLQQVAIGHKSKSTFFPLF